MRKENFLLSRPRKNWNEITDLDWRVVDATRALQPISMRGESSGEFLKLSLAQQRIYLWVSVPIGAEAMEATFFPVLSDIDTFHASNRPESSR